jgi:hypothetical protein
MVKHDDAREEDRAILESFLHGNKISSPGEALRELKKEIKGAREFLKVNRFNGSINRARRDTARKLAYLTHVQNIILERYHDEPMHDHKIMFSGLKKLNILEIEEIERQAALLHRKLEKRYPELRMHVIVKKYNKQGSKAKIAVSLHLEMQGKIFAEVKQSDWDVARTFHKIREAIMVEVERKDKNHHSHKKKW